MARGLEIEFVGDFHQRHIRIGEQFFGVLQLGAVDVLRDGATHILFKNTRQLRVAVRQLLLRRLDLLGGDERVV
jgi:hypothetical protein